MVACKEYYFKPNSAREKINYLSVRGRRGSTRSPQVFIFDKSTKIRYTIQYGCSVEFGRVGETGGIIRSCKEKAY
jgi:hypothetical protein